jgi:hypothetical protein
MKKIIIVFLLIAIAFLALVSTSSQVLAEGDKVRGDKGVGEVYQWGPCPFTG